MKRILFVMLVLAVLVLSSCGAPGPSSTIDVALTDFQFTPNFFTIPAGATITVNVSNTGAVVHNFVIMKLGTEVGAEWTDEEDAPNIYWQIQLEPGGTTSGTFIAPSEPGEYQVICSTPGHFMAGMIGKIVVVAGE